MALDTEQVEQQNQKILTILKAYPEGLSISQIIESIEFSIHQKTLQRRFGMATLFWTFFSTFYELNMSSSKTVVS